MPGCCVTLAAVCGTRKCLQCLCSELRGYGVFTLLHHGGWDWGWRRCWNRHVSAKPMQIWTFLMWGRRAKELALCVRTGFTCRFVCHPVSQRLVEKILNDKFPQQSDRDVTVTIFQLWTYLEANEVTDVEKHVSELAKEGITRMHADTRRHRLTPGHN